MAIAQQAARSRIVGSVETAAHCIAAALCWLLALDFLYRASGFFGRAGTVPSSIDAAWAYVTLPGLESRLIGWAGGTFWLAVAGALALSATEGTWFACRRLSR